MNSFKKLLSEWVDMNYPALLIAVEDCCVHEFDEWFGTFVGYTI
jgi:hypothetical protein